MVGELIAKFLRHSGDLSSLKKFTQTAKVCAFSLIRGITLIGALQSCKILINNLIKHYLIHATK